METANEAFERLRNRLAESKARSETARVRGEHLIQQIRQRVREIHDTADRIEQMLSDGV